MARIGRVGLFIRNAFLNGDLLLLILLSKSRRRVTI